MDNLKLDAALVLAGWQFDAELERFTHGLSRVIDYHRILELIPGMKVSDLADYVTQKHDEWLSTQRH